MQFRLNSLLLTGILVLPSVCASAQDEVTVAPKVAPGQAAPAVAADADHRLAFPSPYARLLGLEAALKKQNVQLDWAAIYNRLAKKGVKIDALGTDRGRLGFVLGVRLADGVIALMAKDSEKLLQCAKDVRSCAQKLGVDRKELDAGDSLARAVEKENWGEVFFELGVMQQQIASRLETNTATSKDRSLTALVASGAWLQGVVYAADIITENRKTEDLSNMLRAAPLAARLREELAKAPADVAALPTTVKSIEVLDQIRKLIEIKRDETIPAEKMAQIQQAAASAISAALP